MQDDGNFWVTMITNQLVGRHQMPYSWQDAGIMIFHVEMVVFCPYDIEKFFSITSPNISSNLHVSFFRGFNEEWIGHCWFGCTNWWELCLYGSQPSSSVTQRCDDCGSCLALSDLVRKNTIIKQLGIIWTAPREGYIITDYNYLHCESKETNYASQMAAQSSEMLGSNFAALLEVQLGEFRFSQKVLPYLDAVLFGANPTLSRHHGYFGIYIYIYLYICPMYSQIMWVFLLDSDMYLPKLEL